MALYDRPRVDLRLTDAQLELRDDAAAVAASLQPALAEDPGWRRQGMLSDGDSREVTKALGEATLLVPSDWKRAIQCLNYGKLLSEGAKRSPLRLDIQKLASRVAAIRAARTKVIT